MEVFPLGIEKYIMNLVEFKCSCLKKSFVAHDFVNFMKFWMNLAKIHEIRCAVNEVKGTYLFNYLKMKL